MDNYNTLQALKEHELNCKLTKDLIVALENCGDSYEDFKSFFTNGLGTFSRMMKGIGDFFYRFSERNNSDINIYAKQLQKYSKDLEKIQRANPILLTTHGATIVPYIEGCTKDLFTLSKDLLVVNQALESKMEKIFTYVNKVLSLTISNKEYQTSKKPIHDSELTDMVKLNKQLEDFFKSTMSINQRKDSLPISEIVPNFKTLQESISNIVRVSNYTTLKDLRGFNEETQDIKKNTDYLLEVLDEGGTVIEISRIQYLSKVLDITGSICSYVSGIVTLYIDMCKTIIGITKVLKS